MSYQALYRKFRPPVWEDVKGQDPIVTTLRNQLITNRIGHAYLFCGTRGTGKTSVAKIFARAVNCENRDEKGNPCGECANCKTAVLGNNMNIIEIDAASNNKVEDARTLINEVSYPPVNAPYKVYIIDEAHMLTKEAENALLKTIEEPPEHAIFILATTEVQEILATIRSRCQRYDFHRIPAQVITKRLKEIAKSEKIDATADALDYIARASDGALRDGLSLLDQCASFYAGETLTLEKVLDVLGAVDVSVFHRFFRALVEGDVSEAVTLLDDVVMSGKELTQFVSDFIWYLRNLMLVLSARDVARVLDMSEERIKDLREQAESTDTETVMRMIRVFSDTYAQMRYDMQKRTLLEMTVVRVCRPSSDSGAESLEARVTALEAQENRLLQALKRMESGVFAAPATGVAKSADVTRKTDDAAFFDADKEQTASVQKADAESLQSVIAHWQEYIPALSPMLKACLGHAPEPAVRAEGTDTLVLRVLNEKERKIAGAEASLREIRQLIAERERVDVTLRVECATDDFAGMEAEQTDFSQMINMKIEEE
ncbi:MAG: DNA polymerase III subunit gamma/tau [Lachnospiraceae bacterium]|nr:DNA polymerase III subunit gamma/tau [Lachnospiraceae bacterium]